MLFKSAVKKHVVERCWKRLLERVLSRNVLEKY